MESILWISPLLAAAALLFALWKAHYVSTASPGNARMQEIAASISEGADAFLKSEYRILAIFVLILFVLIGLFINWGTGLCFLIGAFFSILAGFFGMKVATRANVRTANAAMESGMNKALSIAFAGGYTVYIFCLLILAKEPTSCYPSWMRRNRRFGGRDRRGQEHDCQHDLPLL